MSSRRLCAAGFSLVELTVAIAVIGVIAGAAALVLRGPLAVDARLREAAALADAAGVAGLWLKRELAQAQPNSVTLTPAGAGFRLDFTPRPPAGGSVRYVCRPDAANPAAGTLSREPGGQVLLRHIAACRAMNPQATAYRGVAGRSQLVMLAYTLRAGEARLDVWHGVRVRP